MCCQLTKKSISHFLLGFSVAEILLHAWLKFSALLPLTIKGFTLTPSLNNIILLGWSAAAVLFWYLGSKNIVDTPRCDMPRNRPL